MALTVIIPAAGEGSRFAKVGYTDPKPFILAGGVPMVRRVADMFPMAARIVVICRREHAAKFLELGFVNLVMVDKKTEGAAISVLCAESMVQDDDEVAICNSDNLFDLDLSDFFRVSKKFDGSILTFNVDGGPWSYVQADVFGRVMRVVEKQQISNLATAGLYYFKSWKILRTAICKMVAENEKYNCEFYLAPAYNFVEGNVFSYEMSQKQFISLGTPEALDAYHARN